MKRAVKYEPESCECCGQTTTYASSINKGLCVFLMTFANAVRIKGNSIRMKEIMVSEDQVPANDRRRLGLITHTQYDNRSHLRVHGLIAQKDVNTYCLTNKGAAFLRGEPIEKVAIVEKRTHSNYGYVEVDGEIVTTTLKEVMKNDEGWWDGWDYYIGADGEFIYERDGVQYSLF